MKFTVVSQTDRIQRDVDKSKWKKKEVEERESLKKWKFDRERFKYRKVEGRNWKDEIEE